MTEEELQQVIDEAVERWSEVLERLKDSGD
jgi:hypothetical protein